MKKHFTIKSVLIALLVMISCTMKAEIVWYYPTDDGFVYTFDTETQEATLDNYRGEATEVVIPEFVIYEGKEYNVTSLEYCCFGGCSSLTSVEIPSSVTSLGEACFFGCSSLVSIVVDANNPVYDSREGCNAIIETGSNTMIAGCKSTSIPPSVTSLGNGCFSGCSSLTSVEIPSSVTSLGNSCFSDCSSLTSVEIPSSVTSLGDNCFRNCSSLTSVEIPSSVTSLGDYRLVEI
ncbi:MAG: leucine-rich repeat domain-containing protein [Bacteroidaceae bacterium]|nr:leucine-rich repeat domain-containing protein [Bacteroidaceae bacterium]